MSSAADAWKRRHARDMDPVNGLAAVMPGRQAQLLENWPLTFSPEGIVGDLLTDAVSTAAVDFKHPFVAKLLSWTVEFADRSVGDPRWAEKWAGGYRQQREGNLAACGALARAWLANAAPDAATLDAAAQKLESNARTVGAWKEPEQSQLLAASQLFLIAGDTARAQQALTAKKGFKRIQRYYDWYAGVVNAVVANSDANALRTHFDSWFDVMRGGEWVAPGNNNAGENVADRLDVLRLRLALIRWIHVERQPLAGHWREALAQIAR